MRQHQQFHRKQYAGKPNSNDYEAGLLGGDDDQYASNLSYRMTSATTDPIVDYLSDDESDSEIPAGCNLQVATPVREVICQMLDNYINEDKSPAEMEFPSSLFCHERIFVRQQAQLRNLVCKTLGRGASRVVAVSKYTSDSMASAKQTANRQLTFNLGNASLMTEVNNYLQACPVTVEDNEILQAKIQKTPSSLNDWFYCNLLRSGNSLAKALDLKTRVPDRRFISRDYPNVVLPIDQTATSDNLLHLLENNKIIFLNGPPAIGKSIRVSQYINDDYYDKKWPIRLLHSCANSLNAYALSSILANFHQPIDCCTFDHMSSATDPNSWITITTHEYLLHTLISGDSLLKSSVTHLIVDDVHKRSHTLDMLLAYLKDTQHKFRHLKIILLQTTIQYDTLVKYFGNVATYTIEMNGMMAEEMEEIFLDRVLIDIQGIDQARCLSIANYGVQLLNHWCQLAEQSSIHHRVSRPIICEPCQAIYALFEQTMSDQDREFSDLMGRCFCFGLIEDFQMMIDFIVKHPEKRNYQHPLTLITPLMCLAMWSILGALKRLLAIENVSINLRAVNNFSALDFARKYGSSETLDLLETYLTHDPLLLEQLLSFTNQNFNAIGSFATMKFYLQSRDCDSVVDYQLIISAIHHVCRRRPAPANADHIVVFLPGPDEIFIMNDLFLKFNLSHKLDVKVYAMIDSSSPWPMAAETHSRFLILCDSSCETGLPFLTIGCVIDTGITLEKCSHSTTTKFLPKYNWISQTSAMERKYRATRTGGLCYRLYPHGLFEEKINDNVNAEMARQPLLENIMQAKLFAWTTCSVAEFMLKLPFPPPFATVRAGISQLKNLDLFDKWEDLVDLGAYCLALPVVELPYAMMLVYAHLFKCLEPILVIVSTLTIGDPFQSSIANIQSLFEIKQQLASTTYSDHQVFVQLYQQWQQSVDKQQFCTQWKVKYSRMQRIDRFKHWLTAFLIHINYSHFFYSTAEENTNLNENSSCWLLIQAILVRCLPQNLIIYDYQWLSTRSEAIELDQCSVLRRWQNPASSVSFAICDDIVRTSKGVFIAKQCSSIDQMVLVLFGSIHEPLKLNEYEINTSEKSLVLLRMKLNACLRRKLQSLGGDTPASNDDHSVNLFVKILSNM